MLRLGQVGRRRGFTLVEMLVALAVLSLTLSVVGVVFAITARTTSQSQARSEVNTWVDQFLGQIRADLRQCEPSQSILVLVGRTQTAALTQDELDAKAAHRVQLTSDPNALDSSFDPLDPGQTADPFSNGYSDPRADLLMFFTKRACESLAPPRVLPTGGSPQAEAYRAAYNGAKFTPVQVVYGHASFDDPSGTGTGFAGNLRHISDLDSGTALSRIPCSQWHLSRRQALVYSDISSFGNTLAFTQAQRDELVACHAGDPNAADVIELDFEPYLAEFSPAPPTNAMGSDPAALYAPYSGLVVGSAAKRNWHTEAFVKNILYRSGAADSNTYHITTIADEVPVGLRSNMGVQLLPGCAWFQVEFLMPEDPRNSLEFSPDLTFPGGTPVTPSLPDDMPRWMSVKSGETYVFVPDTQENRAAVMAQVDSISKLPIKRLADFGRLDQCTFANEDANGDGTPETLEQRRVRMWPYAIRVTVRVWDRGGRLEQPIVRSLVHWFE